MTEKELIRRALMGDKKAREECTNRAIILPCPFCGGEATLVEEAGLYSICCKDGTCIGNDIQPKYGEAMCALADWNTRPMSPIGRCVECKHYYSESPSTGYCDNVQDVKGNTDYCSCFEPKEEE